MKERNRNQNGGVVESRSAFAVSILKTMGIVNDGFIVGTKIPVTTFISEGGVVNWDGLQYFLNTHSIQFTPGLETEPESLQANINGNGRVATDHFSRRTYILNNKGVRSHNRPNRRGPGRHSSG